MVQVASADLLLLCQPLYFFRRQCGKYEDRRNIDLQFYNMYILKKIYKWTNDGCPISVLTNQG